MRSPIATVASRCAAVLSGALAVTTSALARAEPQGNAALTIGGAGVGTRGKFWERPAFHLGARGDVLFLRKKARDFGLGPYLEAGMLAHRLVEAQFGGGLSLLLPVHETFPLVVSVGPFGRYGTDKLAEPGVAGAIFWGTRSYNYSAGYVMAAGLSVGYRQAFGESKESVLLVAAQLDLAAMGLPIVLLINALRGPTAAAKPIR
jgi:hypothetical protein